MEVTVDSVGLLLPFVVVLVLIPAVMLALTLGTVLDIDTPEEVDVGG